MTTKTAPHNPEHVKALEAPVTRTTGNTTAPTIMRKIPVTWELEPTTGEVTANGDYAGRVVESIPGKLYYFQSFDDYANGKMWGMFGTAERAAEQGAVRYILVPFHYL